MIEQARRELSQPPEGLEPIEDGLDLDDVITEEGSVADPTSATPARQAPRRSTPRRGPVQPQRQAAQTPRGALIFLLALGVLGLGIAFAVIAANAP